MKQTFRLSSFVQIPGLPGHRTFGLDFDYQPQKGKVAHYRCVLDTKPFNLVWGICEIDWYKYTGGQYTTTYPDPCFWRQVRQWLVEKKAIDVPLECK